MTIRADLSILGRQPWFRVTHRQEPALPETVSGQRVHSGLGCAMVARISAPPTTPRPSTTWDAP